MMFVGSRKRNTCAKVRRHDDEADAAGDHHRDERAARDELLVHGHAEPDAADARDNVVRLTSMFVRSFKKHFVTPVYRSADSCTTDVTTVMTMPRTAAMMLASWAHGVG